MQTLAYYAPWDLRLADKAIPEIVKPDEVVVAVAATGICGTDIGIATGQYSARQGVTLGHEFSGQVLAVGENVEHVKPGDRVYVDPTYSCGHCRMCSTERPNHCSEKDGTEAGVSKDGAFASHYITSGRFVHPMAASTTYEAATLAEPFSCALTGVNQVTVRPDDQTVVIGGGPMGVLYCHALALKGSIGTIVEISEQRRELIRNALPYGWDCVAHLSEAAEKFADKRIDLAVDTSGVMLAPILEKMQRGGRVLLVGLKRHPAMVDQHDLADRSIAVVGSIDSLGTFPLACQLIDQGRLPWREIITGTFPLKEFKQAFRELGVDLPKRTYKPEARQLKALLVPNGAV